jgi:alpha-beta hydrolase superfamily lysophospholipase
MMMLKTKDGLDLFTQQWKTADPKAIVVLHHGFGEHSGRYGHVGQMLNEARYSLYAYDARGHGKSGGPRGHTPDYEFFLDDFSLVIAEARKDQPNKKVLIYGHSMGGNVTLNYALRRPAGLSGVIATGPWLRLAFQPPAAMLVIARLMASIFPAFSQSSNLDTDALSHSAAVGQAYRDDPLVHGTITARTMVGVVNAGERAIEQAPQLNLPALLMHGGGDKITDPKATQQFYERAAPADKTFKCYEGLYHEIHNEVDPSAVFKDMVDWLNRHV